MNGFKNLKLPACREAIATIEAESQQLDVSNGRYEARVRNDEWLGYSSPQHYEKAIDDFTEATIIKPNFAEAYRDRAFAYEKLGRAKEAKEDRAKARRLHELGGRYNFPRRLR